MSAGDLSAMFHVCWLVSGIYPQLEQPSLLWEEEVGILTGFPRSLDWLQPELMRQCSPEEDSGRETQALELETRFLLTGNLTHRTVARRLDSGGLKTGREGSIRSVCKEVWDKGRMLLVTCYYVCSNVNMLIVCALLHVLSCYMCWLLCNWTRVLSCFRHAVVTCAQLRVLIACAQL